ncbi:MAG: hypothetical protein QF366_04715 [Candidatus Poseidoniia archaeon]|nr:hypothetical protein [Candidatus Poseidoniia archaeon]MDP6659131.1 hypothetical protein [Candidatus Poseidoniia archaeon]MDP6846922.1 hypothetical protein [Candidatus Poseidoniia archaeon]MDP7007804.1 hypothetical protein [Candidatus Poseidoniia archaeon]
MLSLDLWAWGSKAVVGGWLPVWVFHLLVLQFALAFALWRFAREWNP